IVPHITTKDSNGKPTTIVTTIPLKPSDGGEADYTTTIDKGNGDFETDLVSHITTKDSNGNPTTIVTTIPLKPSDGGEADYTSVFVSDGHTITKIVTHVTTTDSLGHTVVLSSTYLTYDRVDDGAVFYSPSVSVSNTGGSTGNTNGGSSSATVSVSSSYIGSVFHGDAAQRGANFVSFAIAGLVMALF
ncbi:hypothetical protein AO443_000443, partial [Nakaseomyces glabratus]